MIRQRNFFRIFCIIILLFFFIEETLQIFTSSVDFFEKMGFQAILLFTWIRYAAFAVALILYIRKVGYGWHNYFLAAVLASWCCTLLLSVIFSPTIKEGRILNNIFYNDFEITYYEDKYFNNGDLTIFKIRLEYSIQFSIIYVVYLSIFTPLTIYLLLIIKNRIKKQYKKWLNISLIFIIIAFIFITINYWFFIFEIFAQYKSKKILNYNQIGGTINQQIADYLFVRSDVNHFIDSLYFNPLILLGIILSFIVVIREVLSRENHYNNNLKKKLWAH